MLELGPSDAPVSVIFLHGLGSNSGDLRPVVDQLALPFRFVLPDAPSRGVTRHDGGPDRSWYDVGAQGNTNFFQVGESLGNLIPVLAAECQRNGNGRVAIGGFSQGGAMALHVAEHCGFDLGGVFVMSGYKLPEPMPPSANTPALFCHGTLDQVLPMRAGYEAYRSTARGDRDVVWSPFTGGHEISPPAVGALWQWLRSRVQ